MAAPLVSVSGRVEEGFGDPPEGAPTPHAVVAVYASEEDLTAAVTHLEQAKSDMANISVLGKGMSEERHVVGFETPSTHTTRWAKWGGLWRWIFGAFVFIPGVGHVAVGGYLLFLLLSTGVGATGDALAGALTAVGIPKGGIPRYHADLRADRFLVIAHGTPAEVERARDLLGQTTHERLDHHHHSVAATSAETEAAPRCSRERLRHNIGRSHAGRPAGRRNINPGVMTTVTSR